MEANFMKKAYILFLLSSLMVGYSLHAMKNPLENTQNPTLKKELSLEDLGKLRRELSLEDLNKLRRVSSTEGLNSPVESIYQSQLTALMKAIESGETDITKNLLQKIGNWFDVYQKSPMAQDAQTLNPFEFAIQQVAQINDRFCINRFKIVTLLFNNVPQTVQNKLRQTSRAAHIAAECNHPKVLFELHTLGFNMNTYDSYGYTPLHYAARHCINLIINQRDFSSVGILVNRCKADLMLQSKNNEAITSQEIIEKNMKEIADKRAMANRCCCACLYNCLKKIFGC